MDDGGVGAGVVPGQRVCRARRGVRVSPACLFVLTDAVGVGAGPGLGRVDGCQLDAGVGPGFVETGLVMRRRTLRRGAGPFPALRPVAPSSDARTALRPPSRTWSRTPRLPGAAPGPARSGSAPPERHRDRALPAHRADRRRRLASPARGPTSVRRPSSRRRPGWWPAAAVWTLPEPRRRFPAASTMLSPPEMTLPWPPSAKSSTRRCRARRRRLSARSFLLLGWGARRVLLPVPGGPVPSRAAGAHSPRPLRSGRWWWRRTRFPSARQCRARRRGDHDLSARSRSG